MIKHKILLRAGPALLSILPAIAGQTSVKDLAERSLEELMNIRITSASRKSQSLRTTAAAAFVITSEDIHRSGIRTLPELLRLAPGVQVAQLGAGRWAISIRGFSSDFSNKLLVLIDGRSVYNEEYGGVFWDTEQVPVEDIERIEVIRGPGAAMWGTNAVNGVINVITKSSRNTTGSLLSAEGASNGDTTAVARWGEKVGSKFSYRATADFNGERKLAAPIPSLAPLSGFHAASINFRTDWTPSSRDSVMVTGQAHEGATGRLVFDPTLQNPFPSPRYGRETSYQGQLTAAWTRNESETSSTTVRFSMEHLDQNELYVPLDFNTQELDFEHHWTRLPRQDLVWGGTFRNANYHITNTPSYHYLKLDWTADIYAGFFADEVAVVRNKLYFIAGMQASSNDFTGMEYQPTGRLLWTPTESLTTWAAVSRAVRTPSIIDRGSNSLYAAFDLGGILGVLQVSGNPQFRSEPMMSYELGQRVNFGKRVSVDATAFLSAYQREGAYVDQTPEFVPPQGDDPAYVNFPYIDENARRGKVFGAEVAAAWAVTPKWRLNGSYSWLRERLGWLPGYTAYDTGKDPSQQFQVHSQFDVTPKIDFDMGLYFYGSTLPYGVGHYLRGDARLAWKPTDHAEFSVGVRNAMDPLHPEQYSIRLFQAMEVRRSIYGGFTVRF